MHRAMQPMFEQSFQAARCTFWIRSAAIYFYLYFFTLDSPPRPTSSTSLAIQQRVAAMAT